jgi:hypothetical protein
MKSGLVILVSPLSVIIPGADPGFQVSGGRAEGGAKMFGVFRVKNHDFTPKNQIFSNFRGGRAGAPPWIRSCVSILPLSTIFLFYLGIVMTTLILPEYYCSWPNRHKLHKLLQASSKSLTIKCCRYLNTTWKLRLNIVPWNLSYCSLISVSFCHLS